MFAGFVLKYQYITCLLSKKTVNKTHGPLLKMPTCHSFDIGNSDDQSGIPSSSDLGLYESNSIFPFDIDHDDKDANFAFDLCGEQMLCKCQLQLMILSSASSL